MQIFSTIMNGSTTLNFICQALADMQMEVAVLVIAVCAHALFFGKHCVGRTAAGKTKPGVSPQLDAGACKAAKGKGRPPSCNGGTPPQATTVGGARSQGTLRTALKAALRASNLDAALGCLGGFPSAAALVTAQDLVLQLVRLASAKASVPALLRELDRSGLLRSVCLVNAVLDACVECKDFDSAEQVWSSAVAAGTRDVVTYNTIIKARLSKGNICGARQAMESMGAVGLRPNTVTFNELLDATVGTDHEATWAVIAEMRAYGLQPNRITCSILLKTVQQHSKAADTDRVLAIVDSIGKEMDEVLLSSTLEACIRADRLDLLACQLRRQHGDSRVVVKGSQTYGSIIRAYGCVGDVQQIKRMWHDMRERKIPLTSITLGCTVEALASSGDPDGAHSLIREVLFDPPGRPVVNAVIYCSVIKGFSHQKRFDRVWETYQEMLAANLQPQFSSVTYNTLIDACSRCGEIKRTPLLLEEMLKQGIEPNLVTYSAVLKGYCQDNQLDKARELLDTMKRSKHVRPDEQTYNTLLDGCARQNLCKQGMEVFEEMKADGIRPSNFTLSVLVKLANRDRQLTLAFNLCEELPQTYGFRINVHVYNNLLQACVTQKKLPMALDVLVRMLREQVRPDSRTYALLLRGCVNACDPNTGAGVLRAALGLQNPHPSLAAFPRTLLQPKERLPVELISEVLDGIARHCRKKELALELTAQIQREAGLRIELKLPTSPTRKATDERRPAP